MTTLLIATHNPHKVGEIREILGSQSQFLTLNDFPEAPKIVEDANTFDGNAVKKAVELMKWINSKHRTSNIEHPTPNFVLADDSGLEVDALNGAPGVHSARFAALDRSADNLSANSTDAENNAKLLRLLKDVPAEKRTARFHCVMALMAVQSPPVFAALRRGKKSKAQSPQLFDGVCEGRIALKPRGQNGFGYDPLFVPVGFEQTFAELGDAVKNKLSHRAKALEKLRIYLNKLSM
ncbi:MAG: non-canonical purine NTP pyrophosphatase [Verrucomicrobiota bacterium]